MEGISAGVIMAKVIWKTIKRDSGIDPLMVSAERLARNALDSPPT
jgi:hypothetical protein